MMAKHIRQLARRHLAPDFFGWTPELLLPLLDPSPDDESAVPLGLSLLTRLTDHIANLRLHRSCRRVLDLGKLIALNKKNGVRPLGICSLVEKLAATFVHRCSLQALRSNNGGLQLGLDSCGIEICTHRIRMHLAEHPTHCVLSKDGTNGFNRMNRAFVLNELAANPNLQSMYNYVRAKYGKDTPLVFRLDDDSYAVVTAEDGSIQGCTFGTATWCVAMMPALRDVQARFPRVDPLAIVDDVYLVGPPSDVFAAHLRFDDNSSHMGYSSNLTKTAAYSPEPTDEFKRLCVDHKIQECKDGIIILKTPIGTPEYCHRYLTQVLDQHEVAVQRIVKTKPQTALRLLRFCFLPRLQYLARTVPPPTFAPHAERFDSLVRTTFLNITGIRHEEMTPRSNTLLTARLCQGGLALRSLSLISPIAYFASIVASRNGIMRNNPHFRINLSSPNASPSARIVHESRQYVMNAFRERGNMSPDVDALLQDILPPDTATTFEFYSDLENAQETPMKLQRLLTHCIEKHTYDPMLKNGTDRELAHYHSTSTSESSLWLHSLPKNPRDRLTDQELKTSYRLRLGIACAPITPLTCAACHREFDALGDHSLTCNKTARWKATHNSVRDLITRFLKANRIFVQHEFCVARRDHPNHRGKAIIADHLLLINDQALWLDNATIVSTGASYRRNAARDRRAALQFRSREKHEIYDSHAAAQRALFFALIHDSGGAVNNEWHCFFKTLLRLTDESTHPRLRSSYRELMISVSSRTAKGSASSISNSLFTHTRDRLERNCAEYIAH
jgi:hypothetical protein